MSNETNNDKSPQKEDIFERIIHLDRKTATKYIFKGFIFVILFGAIYLGSVNISNYSSTYYNLESQKLKNAYYNGDIGEREYKDMQNELIETQYLMSYQFPIIGTICRACAGFAMVFVVMGFLGYANNKELDDKTRLVCLITGVLFLFMVASITFSGFRITIGT